MLADRAAVAAAPFHQVDDCSFYVGDCRDVLATLPAKSVHLIVTSPPYYGLRKYEGVDPSVWGGDPRCAHVWGPMQRGKRKDILPEEATTLISRTGTDERQNGAATNGGHFCLRCGAWLGQLGLEPLHSCGRSESGLLELRDDLTDDEREYVIAELRAAGLL